jgi:2-polyprenyl-6-methoxyphenol hydroxylase-like FAD-dependent oxidoreductase
MAAVKGRPHILIAGGGIGGLTAALALLRRGFDVDVYEQASELREVGAGLQLSANCNRALYELGLGEELKRRSCETAGKELRLWNSGQSWSWFDPGARSVGRDGYPFLFVYRPDVIHILADAIRRVKRDAIHLNAQIFGLSQDGSRVTLRFEGGEATGDALIGADGVHSTIRQVLFGSDEPKFTGYVAWRGTIPMSRLPKRMRRLLAITWLSPDSHVVHYPVRGGELMNFVGTVERDDWQVESWSALGTIAECEHDFRGWHEDLGLLIRNMNAPYKWALMSRSPMDRWTVGRASLLGDACHSALPSLGQGAAMAIEDGFILARALEEYGDVEIALQRYENARRDRTRRVVEGSTENSRRFHNRALTDPEHARRYMEREWSEERVKDRYEWVFTYDVTRVAI